MVIKEWKRDDNTTTVTSAGGNHHIRKILTPDTIMEVAESGGVEGSHNSCTIEQQRCIN